MSDWKFTNKTGYAEWDDSVAVWDDSFVAWDGILDVWDEQSKNTSSFTLKAKNVVTSTSQVLDIGDGFNLLIGEGYVMSIQESGVGYSKQSKNISTFTLEDRTDVVSAYNIDIGGGFNLLVDSTNSLEIQSAGLSDQWQLQDKN